MLKQSKWRSTDADEGSDFPSNHDEVRHCHGRLANHMDKAKFSHGFPHYLRESLRHQLLEPLHV
jgi:hypothetical protein